ncbi:ATP-binding protein [Hydrogenophaga sp. 5NK40-0174]|uniref:two-component system sensor histidine kinase NtrB n=1 Tax=Hydrogenophaga sp. 5NK40-0174 TaxID=3127649 RepID=UPI0031085558
MLLLVLSLLAVLVFLAGEYEEGRDQAELEQQSRTVVSDIRGALLRNVQTLQALQSQADNQTVRWEAAAPDVMAEHRELVRLEWRDPALNVVAAQNSAYQANLFASRRRQQARPDVLQACNQAERLSGPAFSPSYFWPTSGGQGLELMEMCIPVSHAGEPVGFLVASYSLPGMLAELAPREWVRGQGLAFTEADGTRLAVASTVSARRSQVASSLLDLPGNALMLRLESPRTISGLFPNVLTAVVSVVSLALLLVVFLLARDMRLRQRAEREVAEALAFRKAMENSLITGLRARDMESRITYVNPGFCQMVGFSADELLGSGLPSPWWPPDRVNEYQRRQEVRISGTPLPRVGYESEFMHRDGRRFPVLIFEAPLINALGEQTGWMSAVVDISEQRRIEEINRATQERMQNTARLANMGEMASLLSHELNQPLAAIASYVTGTANLLSQPAQDTAPPMDDIRLAMQRIGEQAERAGRVIRSVADFVRRRESRREPVSPQALFDSVEPLLALQARQQAIQLDMHVSPDCPEVLCDHTMIEQVLFNLARNGMQAMPEGDPASSSGLRALKMQARLAHPSTHATAKSWVEFCITDHGQGLSPEMRDKIFTPFFTTKSDGMGLGLSLCRTVVEQHGGVLIDEPAQPRGTVFRFTLPAA